MGAPVHGSIPGSHPSWVFPLVRSCFQAVEQHCQAGPGLERLCGLRVSSTCAVPAAGAMGSGLLSGMQRVLLCLGKPHSDQ